MHMERSKDMALRNWQSFTCNLDYQFNLIDNRCEFLQALQITYTHLFDFIFVSFSSLENSSGEIQPRLHTTTSKACIFEYLKAIFNILKLQLRNDIGFCKKQQHLQRLVVMGVFEKSKTKTKTICVTSKSCSEKSAKNCIYISHYVFCANLAKL